MKTQNLIDVKIAINSAIMQNDWYGFQDLLTTEIDYLTVSNAIRSLLDFKTLSNTDLRHFDSTYNEIIIGKRLVNVDDYVNTRIEEEITRNWNSRDYDDNNYSYDDYKKDYLDFQDTELIEYYQDKYETILNQVYKDYFWLGSCLRQITDAKLEMLGQKEKATV